MRGTCLLPSVGEVRYRLAVDLPKFVLWQKVSSMLPFSFLLPLWYDPFSCLVTSILVAIDTFPFIQSAYSFRAHSYLRHHCRFALILYKVRRILDSIPLSNYTHLGFFAAVYRALPCMDVGDVKQMIASPFCSPQGHEPAKGGMIIVRSEARAGL